VICDSDYTQAESKDIFIIILSDAVSSQINTLNLTSMQREALIYCWELSYKIDIIQESLNTEKSYWCAEMIQSFPYKNNIHHSVLIVISMNNTVDELIKKIERAAQKEAHIKDKIIIHLHIIFSEDQIIWKSVKEDCDSGLSVINEKKLNILTEFNVIRMIYEMYKHTYWFKSIVMNKRVQLIEHCLTT